MQYLNILYFLIIFWFGVKFLRSDGSEVRGTLNPDFTFHYSGVELFWCLTFATGLLAFSLDLGVDLMAVRLLVLEIMCIVGMSIAKYRPVMAPPIVIYWIYIAWLIVGLFYTPFVPMGIRTILKYLYPLLLCMFASSAVRDSEVFLKSSILARYVALASLAFIIPNFLGYVFPGTFWYGTARAINYISIMIFSLGMFYYSNKKKQNLIYAIVFLLPCFIWVFRTSILGSGVALMAFFLIKYRLKAIPLIAGILCLGIVSIFAIPSLREKMFYDDNVSLEDLREGNISEGNVNTNMRAYMWEDLEKRFYEGHEIVGSGTGMVQTWMYGNATTDRYGGLTVPHSDFVQQKCDNGLIGLCLYGAVILFMFIDCMRTYRRTEDSAIRLCAIVAGASLLGVYATLYSDNVVNYSMCTLAMPFGFYGMMLGMRKQYQLDN